MLQGPTDIINVAKYYYYHHVKDQGFIDLNMSIHATCIRRQTVSEKLMRLNNSG